MVTAGLSTAPPDVQQRVGGGTAKAVWRGIQLISPGRVDHYTCLRRRNGSDRRRPVFRFDHLQSLIFFDGQDDYDRPTMLLDGHGFGPGRVNKPTEVVLRVPGR